MTGTPRTDCDRRRIETEYRREQCQSGKSHSFSPFSPRAARQRSCLPRVCAVLLTFALAFWLMAAGWVKGMVATDSDVLHIGGDPNHVIRVIDDRGRTGVVRVHSH